MAPSNYFERGEGDCTIFVALDNTCPVQFQSSEYEYMYSFQFERDVVIWNHKKYLDKPLLTKEEHTIVKHRRWYNQFYSQNSPRADKNTLTW